MCCCYQMAKRAASKRVELDLDQEEAEAQAESRQTLDQQILAVIDVASGFGKLSDRFVHSQRVCASWPRAPSEA